MRAGPQPISWKNPVLMRSARYGLTGEWDGPAEHAYCPRCRVALKTSQPDTQQPRKLFGCCPGCGDFYPVVDESDAPASPDLMSVPFDGGN